MTIITVADKMGYFPRSPSYSKSRRCGLRAATARRIVDVVRIRLIQIRYFEIGVGARGVGAERSPAEAL